MIERSTNPDLQKNREGKSGVIHTYLILSYIGMIPDRFMTGSKEIDS